MDIMKKYLDDSLEIALSGRLDTLTSPQLEKELSSSLDGVKQLVLDFSALEYVSSAGLRVLLTAQKVMNTQGSMKICHVRPLVMEVFEITGFVDILTIE